ncbi:MAG: lipopolysaccharide biosynthesis protein [Bacteroidales bacterium]
MNSNKRIVLNTGVLYIKLIITTLFGLYISRLILNALGIEDYGLYSVVGGIVTFMNVLGTTMVSASYRFLAIELGKGDTGNPNRIYNIVFVTHIALALFLILIGETIGLYYVNNVLQVAVNKLPDARFVLHISLVTTAITVLNVPANGLTIARERFVFTSLVEIGSVILKMSLVLWLAYSLGNRLRLLTIIMALISVVNFIAYKLYCEVKDKDIIKFKIYNDLSDYRQILGFAWWSFFGALACVSTTQGSAMMINYFFGTALNASFGIASQVSRYATIFTNSISQAAIPQIMKSYGAGDTERSVNLVYAISRISSLILLIPIVPVILCTKDVLTIWLKKPPEFTNIFVIFLLVNTYVSILGAGFNACIQSTGKIKKNEIGYGIINLMLIPIIFIFYKFGFPPYINVIVLPFFTLATLVFQIGIMTELTHFNIKHYTKETLWPSLKTAFVAFFPLSLIRFAFGHSIQDVVTFLLIAIVWVILTIYFIGVKKHERIAIHSFVKNINK